MPAVACRVPATTYSALVTRVRIPAFPGPPAKAGRMYYVYVLQSLPHTERTYVGFTGNLRERLKQHNSRRSVHTSKYAPWRLVVYVAFREKMQAEKFEIYLKSGSGRAFMKRHF